MVLLVKRQILRRKQKINLAESIFFIVMVVLTSFILLRSSLFEVKSIVVQGNNHLASDKIVSVSGITPGTNIFKLELAGAKENLKVLPMLKSVEMSRVLPSRVVIRVQERQPVALVPVPDGFLEVDEEGVYLQKGSISESGLPVVTGITAAVSVPGQVVRGEKLAVSLDVISELPEPLLKELSEINIDAQGRAVFYTMDGVQCRLGRPVDIAEKGALFMKVFSELKGKGKKIEYVDLSYKDVPAVKYLKDN